MIGPMEEADLFIQMGMFIKASGKMTKLTAKVSILNMMDLAMPANGSKICSMDMVLKNG